MSMKSSDNLNIYFTIPVTHDKKVASKNDFVESRFGVLRSQGFQKCIYYFCTSKFVWADPGDHCVICILAQKLRFEGRGSQIFKLGRTEKSLFASLHITYNVKYGAIGGCKLNLGGCPHSKLKLLLIVSCVTAS